MVFRLLPVIFTICVTESIFCCFKYLTSEINLYKYINKLSYEKVECQLDLLLKGQEVNQQELRLGFIGLAK